MTPSTTILQTADSSNAPALFTLIEANLEEGHLLPRTLGELVVRAERFTIAVHGHVVGCAGALLSPTVAEGAIAGGRSVCAPGPDRRADREELRQRAVERVRETLRVHALASAISRTWVSRSCRTSGSRGKSSPIACDARTSRQCGQYAMVTCWPGGRPRDAGPPAGSTAGGRPVLPVGSPGRSRITRPAYDDRHHQGRRDHAARFRASRGQRRHQDHRGIGSGAESFRTRRRRPRPSPRKIA